MAIEEQCNNCKKYCRRYVPAIINESDLGGIMPGPICEEVEFWVCDDSQDAPVFDNCQCVAYLPIDEIENRIIPPDDSTDTSMDESTGQEDEHYQKPSSFSFTGRITSPQYVTSFFVCFIYSFVFFVAYEQPHDETWTFIWTICLLLFIPVNWYYLAQSVKRSHDLGTSGRYILIPGYILWLLFAQGDPHKNKYGPSAK